jgi:tyrosine-protein kinase Etk/Wzc
MQPDTTQSEQPREQPDTSTAAPGGYGYAEEDTISLLDLVAVLAKRWRLIFFASLSAAVLVVAFSVYTLKIPSDSPYNPLPNVYTPEVKVRLTESGGSNITSVLSNSGLGALAGLTGVDAGPSNAELAQELLKGKSLIDELVDRFDIIEKYEITEYPKTTSRQMIREALNTEYSSATGIMTITYTHIDSEFATEILNAALDELEMRFSELTTEKVLLKKKFLEESLNSVDQERIEAQNALLEFQREHGIVDIDYQMQTQIEDLAELNSGLINLEMDLRSLQQYRRQDDPEIIRLRNEIELTKKLIEQKKQGFSEFSGGFALEELPEIAARYLNLKRDLGVKETIYTGLRQQYETTKIEEADDSRRFQVIERAEVPERKSGPSRGKLCVIVTITVFFLSVFLAFVFEYFSKVKEDPVESKKLKEIKDSMGFGTRRSRSRKE